MARSRIPHISPGFDEMWDYHRPELSKLAFSTTGLDSKRSIVFLCHQGGCPISHHAFVGRCGKFHCSLPATLGISIDLSGTRVKFRELPTSPHKSVVRYPAFLYATSSRATCAAFCKESRMKSLGPTTPHRKSGVWGTHPGGRESVKTTKAT
jgi:hypothetical protein